MDVSVSLLSTQRIVLKYFKSTTLSLGEDHCRKKKKHAISACWLLAQENSIQQSQIVHFLWSEISLLQSFFLNILPQGTHITVKYFSNITPTERCCAVFLPPTDFRRSEISLMLLSLHGNQKEGNVTGFSDYILIFAQVVQTKLKSKTNKQKPAKKPHSQICQAVLLICRLGSSSLSPPWIVLFLKVLFGFLTLVFPLGT